MTLAISRQPSCAATWLATTLLALCAACGGRKGPVVPEEPGPMAARTLPLARVFVLETAGPPPNDTSVTFTTGQPRSIVMYHSGETIAFARLNFEAGAFGDSGRTVQVDIKPRPGIYGVDITTSLPFQGEQARVVFVYGRYFSAPARARQIYGSDPAFEKALTVGQVIPGSQITLLPSTRPAADNVETVLPAPGSYLVAAPQ